MSKDKGIWSYLKRGERPPGWGWLSRERLVVRPGWERFLREKGLDSIAAMVMSQEGAVVSEDRKQQKNRVKRLEWSGPAGRTVIYLKHYYNFKVDTIRKRAFRGAWWPPSMVRKEYENLLRFERWGFPVPEVVAFGEFRFCGGLIHAVLLSAEIPRAMGLDYLVSTWLPQQPPETRKKVRRELVEHLASLTRRMHEHGFEHHDYFLRNIMVSEGDLARLYLLDAPRGRCWPGWIARHRYVQDLATLDSAAPRIFRRTERLRFFLLYRGHERLTAEDKKLIGKVLARAEPWRDRQARRLDRSISMEGLSGKSS